MIIIDGQFKDYTMIEMIKRTTMKREKDSFSLYGYQKWIEKYELFGAVTLSNDTKCFLFISMVLSLIHI